MVLIVTNKYGEKVQVDTSTRNLYDYSNKNHKIVYNAEIVENGKNTGFFTDYEAEGTVDDIQERLKKWNNKLKLLYSTAINFDKPKNDPEGKIFKKFVEIIENNQDFFFDKNGDFLDKFKVSDEEILSFLK